MDQYDSALPPRRKESDTPVYDRLLAEWREAAERLERTPRPELRPLPGGGAVPGPRSSIEAMGGRC